MFSVAFLESGDGLSACESCDLLPTKNEILAAEDNDLVAEIEDIVFWELGGQKTDWSHYPFEYYRLFCIWRRTERQIDNMRRSRPM